MSSPALIVFVFPITSQSRPKTYVQLKQNGISTYIYIKSQHLRTKLEFIIYGDTEWIYFGAAEEANLAKIAKEINNWFNNVQLYVSLTRNDSFLTDKSKFIENVNNIIGHKDFLVWDTDFQRCIEFNRIGVFRAGKISN